MGSSRASFVRYMDKIMRQIFILNGVHTKTIITISILVNQNGMSSANVNLAKIAHKINWGIKKTIANKINSYNNFKYSISPS